MIKITLEKEEDRKLLRKERCYNKGPIAERVHYVLLSTEGKSVKQIADQTGRNPHTIRTWLKKYLKGGIKSLKGTKASGRPPVKRGEVKQHLRKILTTSTEEAGFPQSGWYVNLIKEHLEKKFEITSSSSTIRRALKDDGFVHKRFAKSVPKNVLNREEKITRIKEINEKLVEDGVDEVFFLDEASFSNVPYVQKGWFSKGEKKK